MPQLTSLKSISNSYPQPPPTLKASSTSTLHQPLNSHSPNHIIIFPLLTIVHQTSQLSQAFVMVSWSWWCYIGYFWYYLWQEIAEWWELSVCWSFSLLISYFLIRTPYLKAGLVCSLLVNIHLDITQVSFLPVTMPTSMHSNSTAVFSIPLVLLLWYPSCSSYLWFSTVWGNTSRRRKINKTCR